MLGTNQIIAIVLAILAVIGFSFAAINFYQIRGSIDQSHIQQKKMYTTYALLFGFSMLVFAGLFYGFSCGCNQKSASMPGSVCTAAELDQYLKANEL